LEEFPSRHH